MDSHTGQTFVSPTDLKGTPISYFSQLGHSRD